MPRLESDINNGNTCPHHLRYSMSLEADKKTNPGSFVSKHLPLMCMSRCIRESGLQERRIKGIPRLVGDSGSMHRCSPRVGSERVPIGEHSAHLMGQVRGS